MDLGSLILGAVGGASLVMAGEYAGGVVRRLRDQRRQRIEDGRTVCAATSKRARPPRGVKNEDRLDIPMPTALKRRIAAVAMERNVSAAAFARAVLFSAVHGLSHAAIVATDKDVGTVFDQEHHTDIVE
jgi:hypothetical protein